MMTTSQLTTSYPFIELSFPSELGYEKIARDAVAAFARRLGCDPAPRTTTVRPRVTRISYRGCPDGLRVGVIRLTGTTHSWPGAPRSPFPVRNPSGFRATPAVVAFALAVRRP